MGEHWTLSIKGYDVLGGKNSFDGTVLQLFRREDARIEPRRPRSSEYDRYGKYEYCCTVGEMKARLDLMGFTIRGTSADFAQGVHRELQAEDEDTPYKQFLASYTFSQWLATMRALIRAGEPEYIDSPYPHIGSVKEFICNLWNHDTLLGFFTSDQRFVLRGCLEAAPALAQVKLNLVNVINAGYVDDHPQLYDIFTDAAIEYSRTSPVIILTEGSTDRWVLEQTLPLVYPHLTGFFSFMDFESSNAAGGVGQLVATIKAFTASKIRNRILAVFDNDTAAHAALRGLDTVAIPPNIRYCTLPDLRWAKRYPTDGPQGLTNADINGRACSIELFFGSDIIGVGKRRKVVRWSSLDHGVRQYQGEVTGKEALLKQFRDKVHTATPSKVKKDSRWRDIRNLWCYLKEQAENISLEIIRAKEKRDNLEEHN